MLYKRIKSDAGFKLFNNILAVTLWGVGVLMLAGKSESFLGGLFFVPFSFWPHAVTHIGVLLMRKRRSQLCLLVTMLLYFGWFTYVYIHAFYIQLDPQSGLALLFVGALAAPFMLILWILTIVLELIRKEK